MRPEDILARCRPIAALPVFAVGVTESGVTVASQQRRAIHLVDALLRCDVLAAGSRLAVVGAGAAGLTAAVRAARAGCRVTIFERDAEILAMFRGNDTRLLHPNLYAWPRDGWAIRDAQLPVLSWTAGKAGSVAAQIEDQFKLELHSGLIELRLGVAVASAEALLRDADQRFAAVILAVGFGRERNTGPASPGYWSNDWLGQAGGTQPLRYFIQGAGDGGLTDLLRLRLSLFDQDDLVPRLLPDRDRRVGNLKLEVQRIERLASAAEMDAAYRALDAGWLDDAIEDSGLRPHSVVLSDKHLAFGHRRFALNKLLASRLVSDGERFRVEWLHRELHLAPVPGPVAIDLGDGRPPRRFDHVLFRIGAEGAIHGFGDEIAAGCGEMTGRGSDIAATACEAAPPPGAGPRALSAAVRSCRRVLELVEILLLFLRHAGRPTEDLAADPRFDDLRDRAQAALSAFPIVATDTAAAVAGAAADFLDGGEARVDVAARALVEALELGWRDQLRRSFRGRAGRHSSAEYRPNQVCPRQLSLHDESDVGAGTVALMPPGRATLQIEWTAAAWPARLRIATGRVFESIDDLALHVLREGELVEFFGAEARDAARHAARLDHLASRLAARPIDLVVLPEFALHADPGWASRVAAGLGCIVFAGRGHVRVGRHRVHRSVAAFTEVTVQLAKTAASAYLRGEQAWLEDIHTEPPRLLAVGDGQQLVGLATEDLVMSPAVMAVLAALRPRTVVVSGSHGNGYPASHHLPGLAFVACRFGPPIAELSGSSSEPCFELVEIEGE